MIRIATQSSTYLFDEGGRYMRMPKGEGIDRESFEKLQQRLSNGFMDDNVWNNLREVHFCHHPAFDESNNPSLNVQYDGSITGIITTPVLDECLSDARVLVAQFETPENPEISARF